MPSSIIDIEPVRKQFQEALERKLISPKECKGTPGMFFLHDDAGGKARVSYAYIEEGLVLCLVAFIQVENYNEKVCMNIGYAVAPDYRGKGLGARRVQEAMSHLVVYLSEQSIREFYIEAVVGIENEPSNRIASKLISKKPKRTIDQVSGQPAFQYFKKCP
jgi:RimJ/RimL family protein N-acetyltransferase